AEADIGQIRIDQAVDFTVDAFADRTFHGTVVQVRNAPKTVQNVVTYDVVISVKNDDLKLKPGMTANVSVTVAQRESALKISNAALRFRPLDDPSKTVAAPAPGGSGRRGKSGRSGARERSVYLLSGGKKPLATPVKLGINDGLSTEVLEGLKEGEMVITGETSGSGKTAGAGAANPFGGGMRRY
ncbi:MAG: efflux RND transporter periplasmic adaptor subunit, partial [Verrucomicrobia bacterium]|nr:efflux RND transporter periplasmic adaptor subunit [Verrucomicrobiota bacterium]